MSRHPNDIAITNSFFNVIQLLKDKNTLTTYIHFGHESYFLLQMFDLMKYRAITTAKCQFSTNDNLAKKLISEKFDQTLDISTTQQPFKLQKIKLYIQTI